MGLDKQVVEAPMDSILFKIKNIPGYNIFSDTGTKKYIGIITITQLALKNKYMYKGLGDNSIQINLFVLNRNSNKIESYKSITISTGPNIDIKCDFNKDNLNKIYKFYTIALNELLKNEFIETHSKERHYIRNL